MNFVSFRKIGCREEKNNTPSYFFPFTVGREEKTGLISFELEEEREKDVILLTRRLDHVQIFDNNRDLGIVITTHRTIVQI